MARTKHLLGGKVRVRPDSRGEFDELIVSDDVGLASVHFEMMDDKTLWIALCPNGTDEEVHVTVSARGKLSVAAHEA